MKQTFPPVFKNHNSPLFFWVFCIVIHLFSLDGFGQISSSKIPQFEHVQPQTFSPNNPLGTTANDIIEQTYRNLEKETGTYFNRPHLTDEQNQRASRQFQLQQVQNQAGYRTPNAGNNFNQISPKQKMENEMVELLKESQQGDLMVGEQNYYHSANFKADFLNYSKAKNILKAMLNDEKSLSIKDAFYFSEAAFGNLDLTNQEYNDLIKSNTDFIKLWLQQNDYSLTDPEALHYGIQKFMSDTLYINIGGKRQGHTPYYYDYIDALSGKDRRNYFVTKTIATGSGQCHTFPITYLILAEAIGVDASLAYNPMHSFIRFKNNKGTVVNYETTVDKFLPNSFYIETLPVMAEAQRNNLYVTELNKKQVVASVLFDLAVNFIKEHWLHDKVFISECMSIATPYFPNNGFINTSNNYLHKRLYADDFNTKIQERGIKDFKEIEKYPDVLQAYKRYYNYMESVSKLGIQDFPETEYLRMLNYYDQKGKLQIAKNIKTKTKKSLFIN